MIIEQLTLSEVLNFLTLFGSNFSVIFFLGLQSQFVRMKEVIPSFVTSTIIGATQMVLYKTTPNAGIIESLGFILGGSLGLISSIYAHNIWLRLTNKQDR